MISQRFGKWKVDIEATLEEKKYKNKAYWCICECGTRSIVRYDQLVKGRSSGCKECYAKRFKTIVTKHNMHTSSTYQIWRGIKKRCNLPSHPSYRWYGAEGIRYDPKWETFAGFFEDMGERPEGMVIDRINSLLNYTKENCRWVTPKENAQNRRKMRPRAYQKPRCLCGNKLTNHAKQCWDCYSKTRLLQQPRDEITRKFIKEQI